MESMDNAERTLVHISHLHPLKLVTSPDPKPICHACTLQCGDQSFGCSECRYFLHFTCATAKKNLDHPAHPAHTLTFKLTPPYHTGKFHCNACGEVGNTFSLGCRECNFDLHLHCAALPHKVNHESHCHPLLFCYEHPMPQAPNATAHCEVCRANVDLFKWFYRCNDCNFGGHVSCFSPKPLEVLSPGLQPLVKQMATPPAPQQQSGQAGSATAGNMQKQLMDMELQMMQAKAFADLMSGFNISSLV